MSNTHVNVRKQTGANKHIQHTQKRTQEHVPAFVGSLNPSHPSSNQEMSENGGGGHLMVKARFNFKQNNEDELSFNKGDLICVMRQEEGGWWEGSLNGRNGWFPSNYVRKVKPSGK